MRVALMVLSAGLMAGCSYSPEEQYRGCMRDFARRIWGHAEYADRAVELARYDGLCRLSAGMDARAEPIFSVGFPGDALEMAELLQQLGYDK